MHYGPPGKYRQLQLSGDTVALKECGQPGCTHNTGVEKDRCSCHRGKISEENCARISEENRRDGR